MSLISHFLRSSQATDFVFRKNRSPKGPWFCSFKRDATLKNTPLFLLCWVISLSRINLFGFRVWSRFLQHVYTDVRYKLPLSIITIYTRRFLLLACANFSYVKVIRILFYRVIRELCDPPSSITNASVTTLFREHIYTRRQRSCAPTYYMTGGFYDPLMFAVHD